MLICRAPYCIVACIACHCVHTSHSLVTLTADHCMYVDGSTSHVCAFNTYFQDMQQVHGMNPCALTCRACQCSSTCDCLMTCHCLVICMACHCRSTCYSVHAISNVALSTMFARCCSCNAIPAGLLFGHQSASAWVQSKVVCTCLCICECRPS